MSTIEPYRHHPAPTNNHPTPAPTWNGPTQRIEFLMFGYRTAAGTVQLYGSTDVPVVEIEHEYPDEWGKFCAPAWVPTGPPRTTLAADLRSLVVAHGVDMRSALAALATVWSAPR